MLFYLGTHLPNWLAQTSVPLFVSRRRLESRRSFPRASGPWALDSGGFTELSMHGSWDALSAAAYAQLVRRFRDEIGGMDWAAPQDWMCEPPVIARTGLTVADHQARTVANLLELRSVAPDLPFVPVLQGWRLADYLRCVDLYVAAGVDLRTETVVGVGTICRRQGTSEAEDIIRRLAAIGIRLHAFGAKVTGLPRYSDVLASADSLAWSFAARREPRLPGCVAHKNCANCMRFALAWRERLLASIRRPQQQALVFRTEAA